jgi:Cof subfamily protein (haloacid dehalogenase superfamily)
MNEIRMIITDLDYSLLNNDRQISEYSKNIFNICKEKGIIIAFATARPYSRTRILFNTIEPNAAICHCGGVVYVNNEIIYENGINPIIAKNILENINKNNEINLGLECNDDFYTNFNTNIYWQNVPYKNIDFNNLPIGIYYKIIVGLELKEKINLLINYLPNELYVEIMEEKVGIIMNKKSTKWNGINELLKYYGINKENIISFGDDDVDIEMIENCGIGVAMENGNERIKNKAKYICKNNNEDGIAKWIEENIL